MKISNLDLEYYKDTLDNGLLVYICPMKKHDAHASIVTKFGSDNLTFKPLGKDKFITIPSGTAHFLEHKMFETEKGEDPMVLYSNNGASSNAYTSSNITRYYFTAPSHFFKNLKILLDCITNPYFTKDNIAKEQGIIQEEINGGDADPYQRIYYLANKNLFSNHPHKNNVAGTKESISKLTPEILYDCYNTFYHPSNMYLVITGNVDYKKTIDYLKKYFKDKKYPQISKIEEKKYQENNSVKEKYSEEYMDIANKLLTISYKVKISDKRDKFLTNLYLLIYLDILFSEMSPLYEQNYKDKNILSHIGYFIENVDNYVIIYFDTEVINDETILDTINKEINKKNFTKEDFHLLVKNIVKSAILSTENVNIMANLIVNHEADYDSFYSDFYNIYKDLSYEDCLDFIKNLDFSNYTKGIIKSHRKI